MANPIPEKNTCGRCMNRPYGNSNNLRIELGPPAGARCSQPILSAGPRP